MSDALAISLAALYFGSEKKSYEMAICFLMLFIKLIITLVKS